MATPFFLSLEATITADTSVAVTFPTALPTTDYTVECEFSGTGLGVWWVSDKTASGFTLHINQVASCTVLVDVFWEETAACNCESESLSCPLECETEVCTEHCWEAHTCSCDHPDTCHCDKECSTEGPPCLCDKECTTESPCGVLDICNCDKECHTECPCDTDYCTCDPECSSETWDCDDHACAVELPCPNDGCICEYECSVECVCELHDVCDCDKECTEHIRWTCDVECTCETADVCDCDLESIPCACDLEHTWTCTVECACDHDVT